MAERKYEKYVLTDFREEPNFPGIASPQAYFRGGIQIPGAGMNMGWQVFTQPIHLEKESPGYCSCPRHSVCGYRFAGVLYGPDEQSKKGCHDQGAGIPARVFSMPDGLAFGSGACR